MKRLSTHLPAMPRRELMIVLGQAQFNLDMQHGGQWQITSDISTIPNNAAHLEFRGRTVVRARGRSDQLGIACQLLPFPNGEFELRVEFDEGAVPPTLETETVIGSAMRSVNAALLKWLEPPHGVKLWQMYAGTWQTGVHFDA